MAADPYMTPGSAVADQLQNILARKALEARQSSQDALNAQNVQSQIAARQSQADETKTRISGLNSDRAAQELSRRAGLYSPGQQMIGGDLDYFQKNAPSLVDPGQAAQPQWDYEGQPDSPATGPTFHGLPAQIEKKRVQDTKDAALRVMDSPSFKDLPPVKQAEVFREVTGASMPAGLITPKDQDPWHEVYTSEGVGTGNWKPDKAHVEPRPPKEPVDHGTYVGPATTVDPNDPTKRIEVPGKAIMNVNGKLVVQDIPDGLGLGAKPRAAGANAGKVPPLYGAKEATALLSAYKNKSQSPGAKAARNMAINMFINSVSDPKVKADALQAWTDPDLQDKSLAELQSMLEGDPEHVRKVLEALRASGRQ